MAKPLGRHDWSDNGEDVSFRIVNGDPHVGADVKVEQDGVVKVAHRTGEGDERVTFEEFGADDDSKAKAEAAAREWTLAHG